MAKITYVIDLDNTICEANPGKHKSYSDLRPISGVIDKMHELKRTTGCKFIVHTARGMKTYGSHDLVDQFIRGDIISWLNTHNVPYDELVTGKPGYDKDTERVFYVDDRALSRHEFCMDADHEKFTDMDVVFPK